MGPVFRVKEWAVIEDLIYDVGFHNGNDTAYYLARGYRVVAVEANPALAEQGRQRFAAEIATGRLTLVEAGIAAQAGTAVFWVNDDNTEWSAFDRDVAGRAGAVCRPVEVRCVRFGDILARYGVPWYLKIDIERSDVHCLEELDRRDLPAYVSIEVQAIEYFFLLAALGYDAFKIVDQTAHAAQADEAIGYNFPAGSSGPFGEDTPGPWQSAANVMYEYLHWLLGYPERGTLTSRRWYDIHAKRAGAAAPPVVPRQAAPVEASASGAEARPLRETVAGLRRMLAERTAPARVANEDVLVHWTNLLDRHGPELAELARRLGPDSKHAPPSGIEPFLTLVRGQRPEGAVLRVLDLMPGPASGLLGMGRAGEVRVTTADPLADEYRRLLERHRLAPPADSHALGGHELLRGFDAGTFDLIYNNDSLSLADDVRETVRQMTAVLRPGGYLVLQGRSHRGAVCSYFGSNRLDLYTEGGRLRCRDRRGDEIPLDLDGLVADQAFPRTSKPGDWFTLSWKKAA